MTKELFETIRSDTEKLIAVPYCYQGLKDAANAWLAAAGTDNEHAAAEAYVAALEECVMGIDDVIGFFSSPAAAEKFGADNAKAMLKGLIEHKAAGGKYCTCEACSLGASVLAHKDEMLK